MLCGSQNEHENEIFDDVSDDPFDQDEDEQNSEQTHPERAVTGMLPIDGDGGDDENGGVDGDADEAELDSELDERVVCRDGDLPLREEGFDRGHERPASVAEHRSLSEDRHSGLPDRSAPAEVTRCDLHRCQKQSREEIRRDED